MKPIRSAAPTTPVSCVREPACSATGVRDVEAETGKVVRRVRTPDVVPERLAFSPDGRWLAGPDRVWAVATLAEGRQLAGGGGAAALAFSPDSRRLAAGQADGTVVVWPVGE